MKKMSLTKKILIYISVFISILLFIIGYYYNHTIIKELHYTQIKIFSEENDLKIKAFRESKKSLLYTLSHHKDVLNYFEKRKEKAVINLFKSFLQSDELILQIRILDLEGNEKVRLDRNNDKVLIKNKNELQNKYYRDYFEKFIKLEKEELGISKLDLNIEHGEIELPFKPTVRLSMPIFIDNQKKALLIINYDMDAFMKDLFFSSFFDIYLVDKNDYFIVHPNKNLNWSEYIKEKTKSNDYFLNNFDMIHYKKFNIFEEEYKIFFKDKYKNESFINNEIILFIIVFSAIIFLVLPFIYILINHLKNIHFLNNSLNENIIKFRSIFNHSSDAIILINEQGIIQELNLSTEKIFKYSKDELLGKNVNILVPSPHHEKHDEYIKNHEKGLKNKIIGINRELYGIDKNKNYVPIDLTISKLKIKDKIYFLGTIKDLTKEITNKRLFENIFNSSSIGVALILKDGSFWRINERFCQIVGYTSEELIKLTFLEITYKDDIENDLSLMKQFLNKKIETCKIEKRYIHKNGRIVWVRLNVKAVFTDSSKKEFDYFLVNIDDITEQIELKTKLLEAVRIAHIGHWLWKIDGDSFNMSDNMKNIFGINLDYDKKIDYKKFIDIIHEEDKEYVNKKFDESFSTRNVLDIIYRIIVNNTTKYIHAKGKITFNNDTPIEFFGTVQDITKMKLLEKDQKNKDLMLMEQSKMAAMGEMIGAIAHQWKQPLNSMGFIIQDLISAYKHNEFDEKYLEEVKVDMMEQLEYMSDTINQFKNYFKKDNLRQEFNVINCILDVKKLYQAQLTNNNLDIDLIIDDKKYTELSKEEINTYTVINEDAQLKQVLLNCISNAKEAILELENINKEQRVIEINVSKDVNNNIIISINDLAGGISNKDQNRVFESYFTTKDMGTGIGLYLCKTICEKSLKGSIKYKKNSKDINGNKIFGSSFIISFPKNT